MNRIFSKDLDLKHADILFNDSNCDVIRLVNGDILKLFNSFYLKVFQYKGINLERNLLDSKNVKLSSNILKPKSIVSSQNGSFEGYISKGFNVHDTNFATFIAKTIFEEDVSLTEITKIYKKLEDIIRKNPEVVFPSLCDLTGIYISDDNKFKISNFDELQIGENKVLVHSSRLENSKNMGMIFNNQKYYRDGLYTKNLDKKSLLHIYFLLAFGLDLSMVDSNVTINDILSSIGIEERELCEKINDMFYSQGDNEYLGEDLLKISDSHNLIKRYDTFNYDYSEPSRILVKK